jgi:hypothetical protein
MGGWGLLDHALYDAADPYPLLRLGYASQLSAWALLNSGTAESGYGYWFPGAANDGGAGGGFEPASHGETWLQQPHHRGSWYYSCEIDLGFCGAVRAAAAIVADDPIFGRVGYGCTLAPTDGSYAIGLADGLRQRLHLRLHGVTLDLRLPDARFAAGRAVTMSGDGREIRFRAEPFAPSRDTITLVIRDAGRWIERTVRLGATEEIVLRLGADGRWS